MRAASQSPGEKIDRRQDETRKVLLLFVLLSAGCRSSAPAVNTPVAARNLADDLRRVVQVKEPSYQRLLCTATHIVRNAMHNKEWSAVSQELNGQGLTLLAEHAWQYGMRRQYLVAEKAYTTAGGQNMDLFVEVDTWRETSKSTQTREIVSRAYAGLRATVEMPYAQVLGEKRFGSDTAIHQALLHEEARRAAEEYPFLETVEVYYDVIVDIWQPLHSWGFFVEPGVYP